MNDKLKTNLARKLTAWGNEPSDHSLVAAAATLETAVESNVSGGESTATSEASAIFHGSSCLASHSPHPALHSLEAHNAVATFESDVTDGDSEVIVLGANGATIALPASALLAVNTSELLAAAAAGNDKDLGDASHQSPSAATAIALVDQLGPESATAHGALLHCPLLNATLGPPLSKNIADLDGNPDVVPGTISPLHGLGAAASLAITFHQDSGAITTSSTTAVHLAVYQDILEVTSAFGFLGNESSGTFARLGEFAHNTVVASASSAHLTDDLDNSDVTLTLLGDDFLDSNAANPTIPGPGSTNASAASQVE